MHHGRIRRRRLGATRHVTFLTLSCTMRSGAVTFPVGRSGCPRYYYQSEIKISVENQDRQFFEGRLVTVPFATGDLRKTVANEYRRLLDEYEAEDILIVMGSPTSMETFRESLGEEVPGAGIPYVTSPIVHATEVVNRTDDRAVLSDTLRRELLHRFLEDREWESDYLRRASEKDSFRDHVAVLMETMTWQGISPDETQELVEINEAIREFQKWLGKKGHMERGQLISTAVRTMRNAGKERRGEIVDLEAVLVAEFEEFFPADRLYLSELAKESELVCVAERNSSLRRTLIEKGKISDAVSFTTEKELSGDEPDTRPSATGAYLATGDKHKDPSEGEVTFLEAETKNEQIEMVANEIERLVEREGWSYDNFAVALKNSSGVTEAVKELQNAGLPTESTTVTGFGDDPAVRELLGVARSLADGEEAEKIPVPDRKLLEEVESAGSLEDSLRMWATESGMKERIAEATPPLDARAQFGNVRRVFRMAEFVDDTDFIDGTWKNLAEIIERAHGHAPQRTQTGATEHDGGVRVDHVRSLKNGDFRVVFLLDVVDPQYPGGSQLTQIFPQERVSAMPDYPGVTQVSEMDVEHTFGTESTESVRPFRSYHTEHARRTLAVGADTATDRLYLCLYSHGGTGLENRVQPSRFLEDMYRSLSWMGEVNDPIIRTEHAAEEFLLSRVDNALDDVRRANTQEIEVSLDDVEKDLVEISRLLDRSGERGQELRKALRARLDFAEGRVRRD